MATPRVLIIRAPGTNCDFETSVAFEKAGANVSMAHINQLINDGLKIKDYQVLVFPGGFTYGDDLGAGRIMGNEIRIKLGEDIDRFIKDGGLILGIC
ncbi:MAG: phosphoribosylformylglycinamidine synthase subunit PurQ, partial [Dehalococcoidales bacterium]|nr:phosphoribosylformylglycinamidine synthase subunit PurQ [Dehalococcoidales bacterium]